MSQKPVFQQIVSQQIVGSTAIVLFGPPPVIDGEDLRQFAEIWECAVSAVKPANFIEEIYVRDFVDRTWEISRLRRLKTKLLELRSKETHAEWLAGAMPGGQRGAAKMKARVENQNKANELVEDLAKQALTTDFFMSTALSNGVEIFDRVEHQIARIEAARNAALREIDRRRFSAAALKRLTQQIDAAAEFDAVPAVTDQSERDGHE